MRLTHPHAPQSFTGSAIDEEHALQYRRGRIREFLRQHPWITDVTVALCYLAATLTDYRVNNTSHYRVHLAVLIAVMTIAILFRRLLPFSVFVFVVIAPLVLRMVALGLTPDPPLADMMPSAQGLRVDGRAVASPVPFIDLIALPIACYALGAEKKLRISLPTIVIGWVGLLFTVSVFADPLDRNVWNGVLTLFMAVGFLIGSNVHSSRLRVTELEKRAQQIALEHEQREQLAVSQERTRIAREMHDVVAHSLSVMVTLAEGASVALENNPAMAKTAITQLAEVGRESLQDTRRLVGVLRQETPEQANVPAEVQQIAQGEAPRDPQPGERDVTALVTSYQAAGIPVHFHESGPALPPDTGLHLAIYRIVQEALTNVLRYARSSPRIDVAINRSGGEVVVTIENVSGDGSAPLPGSGKGVIGMRERAAVFDGTVHAGPTTTGWQVRASLRIPGQPHTWTSPI